MRPDRPQEGSSRRVHCLDKECGWDGKRFNLEDLAPCPECKGPVEAGTGRPGPAPKHLAEKRVPHQCRILPTTSAALAAAGGAKIGADVMDAWALGNPLPPRPSQAKVGAALGEVLEKSAERSDFYKEYQPKKKGKKVGKKKAA